MTTCQHCRTRKATRCRGLCHRCSLCPAVRTLYPDSGSKYARRGVPEGSGDLPAEPTPHPPGTPEKQAVLAERAAAGVTLFHPHDARG